MCDLMCIWVYILSMIELGYNLEIINHVREFMNKFKSNNNAIK